jgi:hypothetical protein
MSRIKEFNEWWNLHGQFIYPMSRLVGLELEKMRVLASQIFFSITAGEDAIQAEREKTLNEIEECLLSARVFVCKDEKQAAIATINKALSHL